MRPLRIALLLTTFGAAVQPCGAATPKRDTVVVFSAASLAKPIRAVLDSFARRTGTVVLARERSGISSARNVFEGVVAEVVRYGALAGVTLDVGDVPLVETLTAGSVSELGLLPGSRVVATIKATAVHLC